MSNNKECYNVINVFNKAISQFDFDKVQIIMKTLDWHWGKTKENIPTISEMKECVKELYYDAISCAFENNSNTGTAGTGGFEVFVEKYKDENDKIQYFVEIKFIPVSWDEDSESLNNDNEEEEIKI